MHLDKKKVLLVSAVILLLVLSISTVVFAISPLYIDNTAILDELNEQINSAAERQAKAHEFAEHARYFGYAETDEPIVRAVSEYNAAQSVIEDSQNKIEQANLIDLHTTPTKKVGLSVAAFNRMLQSTALEGQGRAFYDLEQSYDVNGVFAIAVSNTESTMGQNCYGYNPFGMLSSPGTLIRYNSWYDAVMAFGKLMQKSYYNSKSIEGIASTYCPPTSSSWANTVRKSMSMLYSKLEG